MRSHRDEKSNATPPIALGVACSCLFFSYAWFCVIISRLRLRFRSLQSAGPAEAVCTSSIFQEQELSTQVYRTELKDASQDAKVKSGLRRIAEGRFR